MKESLHRVDKRISCSLAEVKACKLCNDVLVERGGPEEVDEVFVKWGLRLLSSLLRFLRKIDKEDSLCVRE